MTATLRSLTMHFYTKKREPWVKLIAEYESGETDVLCDTELDSNVIRLMLKDHDPKKEN